MAEVKQFRDFDEYVEFNSPVIQENPMLYHFLDEMIGNVYEGNTPIYKYFNILVENGSRIILLFVQDVCLVYANNFTDEMIDKLSIGLEFYKFRRYQFAGNKAVIDALFKKNNASYKLQKHRIIYRCHKVNEAFNYSPGEFR